MAANTKNKAVSTIPLAKRVVTQFWQSNSLNPTRQYPPTTTVLNFRRRTAHTSVYDKNEEDLSHNVVLEDVNQPQSDKYWAPHPKTGVFGPASEQSREWSTSSSLADGDKGSILEEKAWFRPNSAENPEKPL